MNNLESLRAMQSLATALWSSTSWWHPGGLGWNLLSSPAAEHDIRVWQDGPRIVAWGWIEPPGHLRGLVDPARPDLAVDVVRWLGRSGGDSAQTTPADRALVEALVDAGYTPADDGPFDIDMRRPAAGVTVVPVSTGYTVRGAHSDETTALVALHRGSWRPSELPFAPGTGHSVDPTAESTFTIEAMRRVESSPLYERDLHVVAEAPDGQLAASCIAWLDPATGAAEIEPVGTRPDHRGRGLAASVCLEAVRRVYERDGIEVVIHPRGDDAYPAPRAVYARCGFEPAGRTRLYTR